MVACTGERPTAISARRAEKVPVAWENVGNERWRSGLYGVNGGGYAPRRADDRAERLCSKKSTST